MLFIYIMNHVNNKIIMKKQKKHQRIKKVGFGYKIIIYLFISSKGELNFLQSILCYLCQALKLVENFHNNLKIF